METAYKSKKQIIKIDDYIDKIDKDKIDLNPEYQRDLIWSARQRSEYIRSQLYNKTPGLIVVNRIKDKSRIIDGKQRSNTIKDFKNNRFSIELAKDEIVYYNDIPKDISDEDIDRSRVMSKKERKYWGNLELHIEEYDNLSYSQESELFTNLQNGTPLRAGEKIVGYISSDKNAHQFNKIAESLIDKFSPFCKVQRRDHHLILMQFMYFDEKLSTKMDDCRKNLIELEKSNELISKLKESKKRLDWMLNIMNSDRVPKYKKMKKVFYTLLYGLNRYYIRLKNEDQSKVTNFIANYVSKLDNSDIDLSDKFSEVTQKLFEVFEKCYNKTFSKKNSKTIDEDSNSTDEESGDEEDENSSNEDSDGDSDNSSESSNNEESDDEDNSEDESSEEEIEISPKNIKKNR